MIEYQFILGLIKSHYKESENDFKNRCRKIVNYFDDIGQSKLAEHTMGLIGDTSTFCPQSEVE